MKKTLHIILAFSLGILVASSGVFAAVGDRIEVLITDFTITVDGAVQELDADILNRNGTTYLPVRTIANMLGKDVVFKGDSRQIELNTPKPTQAKGDTMKFIDFSKLDPDTVQGVLNSLKATLARGELDEQTAHETEINIANAEAHLNSLGDYKAIIQLERDIESKKFHIENLKDVLATLDPDTQTETYEMQLNFIRKAEAELADLESQRTSAQQ